jgi:hypothetical protein
MSWISRKRALAVIGCACAIGVAGIAVGYFTSSGSGTGTSAVGSSSAVTLHATISSSLYPGSSSATARAFPPPGR